MQIGLYDPYLDDGGGGEKYMMTIAETLSQNHNVHVFWNNKKDVAFVAKRFGLDLSRVQILPNIFSSHISLVKRFFATQKYDAMILLSDGSIPLVGAKKLFLHVQQPLEKLQIYSVFDKIKLHKVTAFFCNSAYTQKYIAEKFHVASRIIYPPVDLCPEKAKKENIILHVGRFRSVEGRDYKKQSVMIQVFKKMVDNGFSGWRFVIGTSVLEKDITAFEQMKNLAKGYPITFLINQSNKNLWQIYAKAKIYWHASGYGEDLSLHPELAEHFGISTVEAMSAGAVPIVINAGGQKEIVQNAENGFLWDSLEALADKTNLLAKNVKLWERLSDNAKETAKKFSKEKFSENITKLIQ